MMKTFLLFNFVVVVAVFLAFHYLRVNNNLPSQTCMIVTFMRALGNVSPTIPGFSDPFAHIFLPSWRFQSRIHAEKKKYETSPNSTPYPFLFRRLCVLIQYRTVILDTALKHYIPFDQLVILGAGLDARAWRLKELATVKVFEVDQQSTQDWKIQRAKGILSERLAEEINFVRVDFTKDDLLTRLEESGFDRKKKTFWIWEGVTMYLENEDIMKTLRLISQLSEGGGGLALTYLNNKSGKIPHAFWVSLIGEPFRSVFHPETINKLAKDNGDWITESNTGVEDWNTALTPGYEVPFSFLGQGLYERVWVGKVNPKVIL